MEDLGTITENKKVVFENKGITKNINDDKITEFENELKIENMYFNKKNIFKFKNIQKKQIIENFF